MENLTKELPYCHSTKPYASAQGQNFQVNNPTMVDNVYHDLVLVMIYRLIIIHLKKTHVVEFFLWGF